MYSTHRLKRWERTRCKFPGFQVFQVFRFSRCKFSRHQCPDFLLGILLTMLSLEAVATASVISIYQHCIRLPFSEAVCLSVCLFVDKYVSTWSCLFVSSSSRHLDLHLSLSPSTFWHRSSSLRLRELRKLSAHTQTHRHKHTDTLTQTHIHTYTQTHRHRHRHTDKDTHTHTHTGATDTHTQTHTERHIHTQKQTHTQRHIHT